jgi:hypothetical protein
MGSQRRGNGGLIDPVTLGLAHGSFNVVAGVWPLVSLRTFEAVFGPKADRWLVFTVSGLLVANGVSQIASTRRGELAATRQTGLGTAATLLTIDLIYVPKGRIRWTYLIDAAAEAAWIGLWARIPPRHVARSSQAGYDALRGTVAG